MFGLPTGGLTTTLGFSPSDPRIQPFIKQAREEQVFHRVKVLVSNGLSEPMARQEAERDFPMDKNRYVQTAILKYFESLSGGTNGNHSSPTGSSASMTMMTAPHLAAAAALPSPWSAMFALQQQQLQYQLQMPGLSMAQGAGPPPPVPPAPPSSTQNSVLQQLLQGISNVVASKSISSAAAASSGQQQQSTPPSSTGVSDVLAAAQANVFKSRLMSRFDMKSPQQQQEQQDLQSQATTTLAPSAHPQRSLSYFSQVVASPQSSSSPALPSINLERQLQEWKYQVFSSHRIAPRGMQGKQWRSRLNQFLEKREREIRDGNHSVIPQWLTDRCKPTVTEILNETGPSDGPYPQQQTDVTTAGPVSQAVAPTAMSHATSHHVARGRMVDSDGTRSHPPPPPPHGGAVMGGQGSLSPVSSSADEQSNDESNRMSHTKSLTLRRGKRKRQLCSRSPSSMARSSSSETQTPTVGSYRRMHLFPMEKHHGKRARIASNVDASDFIPLTMSKKRRTKAERKAAKASATAEERKKRNERMRRFGLGEELDYPSETSSPSPMLTTSEGLQMMSWHEKLAMLRSIERVIGRSQLLEKPYLRLCGPPDPALVRPEEVLVKSLRHCLDKWRISKDYHFIEEQFRSIRQDITVQGIRNAFTIEVYEANARVALENADLGQFNQCQTQLRELHTSLNVPYAGSHREEFLCYRILYLALMNMRHDLLKLFGEFTPEEKQLRGVKFGDAFRRAFIENNLHRVLRLTAKGPFLSSTLIRVFVSRLRMMYLVLICKAHYSAELGYLTKELMFDAEWECRRFLTTSKSVWRSPDQKTVDCRKSLPLFEASPLLQARKIQALG